MDVLWSNSIHNTILNQFYMLREKGRKHSFITLSFLLKFDFKSSTLIFQLTSDYFVFCSDNLQLLRQRYYYATWKADGTRYMMLITCDACYLIDRKFLFRRINMRFPCRYSNGVYIFIQFTIIAMWDLCLFMRKISGFIIFISDSLMGSSNCFC